VCSMADAENQRPSSGPESASEGMPRSLVGSVTFLVSDDELIEPLYEDWEPDPID
jgi:hypothetical protein